MGRQEVLRAGREPLLRDCAGVGDHSLKGDNVGCGRSKTYDLSGQVSGDNHKLDFRALVIAAPREDASGKSELSVRAFHHERGIPTVGIRRTANSPRRPALFRPIRVNRS